MTQSAEADRSRGTRRRAPCPKAVRPEAQAG
jgi:hypothetical protein